MTGDPLDRAAEAIRDATDAGGDFTNEPVGMAGEAALEVLVEVARAARGVQRYARRVDLDFAASKGYDLDAALARLPKEQP